jgi:hypothetical protein
MHKAQDIDRTKAELALQKVQADLEKLGDTTLAGSRWIDLLKLIDPSRDGISGDWQRGDAGLTVSSNRRGAKLQTPIVPLGNYELQVKLNETSGGGGVLVHLPLPASDVMLIVGGWGNAIGALELVNGDSGRGNVTTTPCAVENNHPSTLLVRVSATGDQVAITATLDGKPVTKWSGPQSALSVHEFWAFPQPKCLGLSIGGRSSVIFQSARLRMTSGKAVPLDKYTPPPPPPERPSRG